MGFPGNPIVTGPISVSHVDDTYPTHYDTLGYGGSMSIDTITNRNAIPTARRKFGMLVTVYGDSTASNNKTYRLCNTDLGGSDDDLTNNSNWLEFGSLTIGADLQAIEALASTGFAVRTTDDTWAQRTLTTGNAVTVVNGNGVSGNPVFNWGGELTANTTVTGTGTYSVTLGSSGSRITTYTQYGSGQFFWRTGAGSINDANGDSSMGINGSSGFTMGVSNTGISVTSTAYNMRRTINASSIADVLGLEAGRNNGGAVGHGAALVYKMNNEPTGTVRSAARASVYWLNATDTTETAGYNIKMYSGGTANVDAMTIDGSLGMQFKVFGPLVLKNYATGSLPTASSHQYALAYDSTTNQVKKSDGSTWTPVGGTVSGTSGQVAYFNGTSSITSEAGFEYNSGTDTLTVGSEIITGDLILQGISQDDSKTRILAADSSTGQVFWRDSSTLGGGGISDGDKGDVTVSSSGTVWTVNNLGNKTIDDGDSPYTIVEGDRNTIIYVDTTSDDVVIDLDTTVTTNNQTIFVNIGTNSMIFDEGGGTFNSVDDINSVQYTAVSVWYAGSNTWYGVGVLGASGGGGGGGHEIENSNSPVASRTVLNITNGLRAVDNNPDIDVKLGGSLIENTTITGNSANSLSITGVTSFLASSHGTGEPKVEITTSVARLNVSGVNLQVDSANATMSSSPYSISVGSSGITFAIPSAAENDLYIRGSGGYVSRVGIGSALQVLRVNGTGTQLEYATIGSLTDGDKGDVTVSSGGTVWTVDNMGEVIIDDNDSPYTISNSDRNKIIYVDTSSGNVTIDLDTAVTTHNITVFRNVGTGLMIFDAGGGTLNSVSNTCSTQWGDVSVWYDGSEWHATGALGAPISGTAGQVAYFSDATTLTGEAGFEYNSSTDTLTVPRLVSSVNTGSNAFTTFRNTDNTTGGLRMLLETGGSGDVFMTFDISGGLGLPVWAMGVDNSASDTFKLEYNTNQLGAGTAALSIATTGATILRAAVGSTATESPLTISRSGQAEQGAYIILGDANDDSLQTRTITTYGDGSSESLTLAPRGGIVNISDFAGGNTRALGIGTIAIYSYNGGAATLESAIYGGSGTNNHPFLIRGNQGDSGTNDGASITIQGGAGYVDSGNGDGGSILIQSGQRRIAGTGDDGNITLDALTGYLILANVPTSATGLPTGAIWSDGGVLTIV